MFSKCSVVNYHTVLLAFASTVSPTASPKSSEKRASSRRPENGQRLAGNVDYTEVIQDGHRADQYPEVGLWSGDDLEHGRIKVSGEAFSVDAFLMFPCIVYV